MVEGGDGVVKVVLVTSSPKFSTTGPEQLPVTQRNLGAPEGFPPGIISLIDLNSVHRIRISPMATSEWYLPVQTWVNSEWYLPVQTWVNFLSR